MLLDIVTQIMLVIWTNEDQLLVMFSLLQMHQLVGSLFFLQSIVALSTTEAEYMAITKAAKEAIWLQGLLRELGIGQEEITIFCDSQSAIQLAKNQVYHARTKHIDVRYHFIREIIEDSGVIMQKIHTTDNPADMLTKVVTTVKFQHCLNLINIVEH